jgi:chemotaxis protein methyltransferase CheR
VSQAAKKLPPPGVSPLVVPVVTAFDTSALKQPIFEALAQKIYQIAGIHLPYNEKNVALMSNRLTRLMRDYDIKSFDQLNEALKIPSEKMKQDFVSALTTNKTDFFREEAHFDFLKAQWPQMFKAKPEVRIWSSACSAGSEPYTLAVMAAEQLNPIERQRLKILATDIDLEILKKAVKAQYTSIELEGLLPHHKQKYFKQISAGMFELIPELAKSVHFSEFNLMNFQHRFQKKFDVIFCRNVLIYFDKETTDKVLELLVSNLDLNGYLIIGHSESGVIRHPCLKALGNSIFQKVRN